MLSRRTAISNWAQRGSWVLVLSFALFGCSRQRGTKGGDAGFVERAAAGGLAEVRLGQLAQERGTSVAVKDFGAQMVADHMEAGNKLQIVARQVNLSLPAEMSPEDRSLYAKLSNLRGIAFDQVYATAMVNDHEADVADFEKEANQGQVSQVRQFASETLPTLKGHLDKARELQKTVVAGAD